MSVMEKAATGGGSGAGSGVGVSDKMGEMLPVVFLVPKFWFPSPLEATCSGETVLAMGREHTCKLHGSCFTNKACMSNRCICRVVWNSSQDCVWCVFCDICLIFFYHFKWLYLSKTSFNDSPCAGTPSTGTRKAGDQVFLLQSSCYIQSSCQVALLSN